MEAPFLTVLEMLLLKAQVCIYLNLRKLKAFQYQATLTREQRKPLAAAKAMPMSHLSNGTLITLPLQQGPVIVTMAVRFPRVEGHRSLASKVCTFFERSTSLHDSNHCGILNRYRSTRLRNL